jgi:hypothetical protein
VDTSLRMVVVSRPDLNVLPLEDRPSLAVGPF